MPDPFQYLYNTLNPNPRTVAYRTDPNSWAEDKLDAHLWSAQRRIANSVVTNRRTAVKSCHGVGKSWTAGMIAAWWIDTHPPGEAMVVSTAPSYKQVHAVLWEEIRKQHHIGQLPGVVTLTDEWKIGTTLVGMGRKPADHDRHGFQGIHRRYVLALIDEACGVNTNLYTAVEAITTNDDCRILAIGNPDDPNTEFGKICGPGSGWSVQQISAFDSPNLTGETVPAQLTHLLPSREWVENARTKWGESSPLWSSKVLGEFPETSENTLIPASWITAAQTRDLKPVGDTTLGVDVARYGTDKTVIGLRRGPHFRILRTIPSSATTQTAGEIIAAQRHHPAAPAQVDGVGVGGGVVDMMREYNAQVEDMQAGAAANDRERFLNARAEWYWGLRERFETGDIDLDPDDDDLASQLSSLRFEYTSRGQLKIESKDDMAKRGMPSPDRADALMLAYGTPHANTVTLGRW